MFDYKDIDVLSPLQSDSNDEYTEVYVWGGKPNPSISPFLKFCHLKRC